jgi:hypothetical protein
MSLEAIKTIRIHNWGMTRLGAKKLAQETIDILLGAYPTGVESDNETYYVIPGFEHVTKHQPVVAYHPTEGWVLQTRDLFLLPRENN